MPMESIYTCEKPILLYHVNFVSQERLGVMSGPTTLVIQTTISGMEQNLQLKSTKESYYHISGKYIL